MKNVLINNCEQLKKHWNQAMDLEENLKTAGLKEFEMLAYALQLKLYARYRREKKALNQLLEVEASND